MAELSIVKQLTNIMRQIAALPTRQHPERWFRQLAPKPDEKASAYRIRALDVIGQRWNRSADTVRSMEDGHRHGKDAPVFLRDLQKYGGVKFRDDGSIDPTTFNQGPDPMAYILSLPTRKRPAKTLHTVRRSARA